MKRVHLWGSLKKSLNVQSDEVLINQMSRTKTGKKDSFSLGFNGFNFFNRLRCSNPRTRDITHIYNYMSNQKSIFINLCTTRCKYICYNYKMHVQVILTSIVTYLLFLKIRYILIILVLLYHACILFFI